MIKNAVGGKVAENNPVGIVGVDFIEYTGSSAQFFESLFLRMGFKEISQIPGKQIRLFRQGKINFVLNTEPETFAAHFAQLHGPSICSTAFKVQDAQFAFKTAVSRGARPFQGTDKEKGFTSFPAIYGIGDSLVYFIDQKGLQTLYGETFKIKSQDLEPYGVGLKEVDHFTNNVPKGEMKKWSDFYEQVFNFREVRYFDIRGKQTGLLSKAMRSPCSTFSIPINEPTGDKSQIQEFIDEYKGSGIQHLALSTEGIVDTLETMKSSQIEFLTPPPKTYYAMLKDRLPNVLENIDVLEKNAVLVDGDHDGYLLQIFTKNVIGPIFYEIIQRRNHFGFGEGNFQALFDAIERDQKERGYL